MSEQSTSPRASANGPQDMTPSEAFVETLAANGVTDMFGIMEARVHGCDGHLRAGRHPPDPGRARTGRGPHGRRLCARVGPPRRRDRPERPRHQQLRDGDRGRVLGAQPGRDRHAGSRHDGHRPRRLPGSESAADVPGVHEIPGPCHAPGADGRIHRALLRPRAGRDGPDPAEHPARLLLRQGQGRDSATAPARSRRRRRTKPGRRSGTDRAGEIPGDHLGRRRRDGRRNRGMQGARRTARRAGRQQLPAQRLVPGEPSAVVRPARLPGARRRR